MKHLGTKVLETERLILRPFKESDTEAIYNNWASDPEVTKYLSWPTHTSIEMTKKVHFHDSEQYAKPDHYNWAIVLKELGEPIGAISAYVSEDVNAVHLGYCIGKKWWRKGITPEAVRELFRFFFEEVEVQRISAFHDPENAASGAVMRKCGMTYEGTLRRNDRSNRGIVDKASYSILREEYVK